MRRDRPGRQWSASVAGAALLFILSGSAVTLSASPDPSASPEPTASESASPTSGPTDEPSATPSPSASPSPSAVVECESPWAEIDGDDALVRGETVRVRFSGFTPNLPVTLIYTDTSGDRKIGAARADGTGSGLVEGVVPMDAPIGEDVLQVTGDDGCMAFAYFGVLGSPDTISIDDATVLPGQRVTVRAGGFLPNEGAVLTIDNAPVQGECIPRCLYLSTSRTNALGMVVFHARIPRDISAGRHVLWVTGGHLNGISDAYQSIEITVRPGSTLPPTDTASRG